jgi:class 3 adenylate cyclase
MSFERASNLNAKVLELEQTRSNLMKELSELRAQAIDNEALRRKYADTMEQLRKKDELSYLINAVEPMAREKLLETPDLANDFTRDDTSAFVMSIDIRRSTELMLKATSASSFANFIRDLCEAFRENVLSNHGVFDKFTGDGILAFFPGFYSGEDAGYFAVRAASKCHDAFRAIYRSCRSYFDTVMNDVGLGIGIDFGTVQLVRQWGNLTVVGKPVVYACRLGGAKPGETLLNQQAHDEVAKRHAAFLNVEETEIEIKHEGRKLAYRVTLGVIEPTLGVPQWFSKTEQGDAANTSQCDSKPG